MHVADVQGARAHLEKQVHSAKGRELVEHASNVQKAKVLERQLSHRGKRQAMGAKTKQEREQVTTLSLLKNNK